MGLFTGSSSASRRPTSAAPLKRRSLGRSRESLSKSQAHAPVAPSANGGGIVAEESIHNSDPQSAQSGHALDSQSAQQPSEPTRPREPDASPLPAQKRSTLQDEDDEAEPELADLQSDNTFLYDRQLPLDSALGTTLDHPPEPGLLERIDAHVAEHYLDCFGITHHKELTRHDNRIVPLFAKAPRFLSIHSLKRKDLEWDYTEVADTIDTCPREHLCLGRSSECSLESGEWNDEDQSFYFDAHPTPYESFDPDQSFEGYQYIFTRPRPDVAADRASFSTEPLGSTSKADHEGQEHRQQQQQQRPERCCFNCGESDHAVAQCPHPKDRERIRQRRLEFEAQRGDDDDGFGEINGHARLHEQFASAEQRLRWLDEFVPGKPSQALIDALLPATDDHGWGMEERGSRMQSASSDLPYLHRMLVWGYPPGWISTRNPIEEIRQRIQSDSQWDSVEVLAGFDVAALDNGNVRSSASAGDTEAIAAKQGEGSSDGAGTKRWVDYHTDLFDSYRLQSFDTVFRAPLPRMPEQAVQVHSHDGSRSDDRRWSRPPHDANEGWIDRPRKRSALWKRLLRERSDSPPPPPRYNGSESANRRAPVRIDRPHPYAPPRRISPEGGSRSTPVRIVRPHPHAPPPPADPFHPPPPPPPPPCPPPALPPLPPL
ncbi:uncharacterized protein SRS1_12641 [Sporisorium reilianum f. sp. reilianum]|uniref:CCHC-type domain-containing protein n=1 Tax=Sporisorium reilianum f. sp. reilianum TaxID=72559 RepID=A0A2N8U9C7_9BASI|nr:uncharacterized protein SRS1_12641 [Sporisorium reilianum f. sp. reilianum]